MQKGLGVIYILVGVLILGLVVGGAYYLGKQTPTSKTPNPVVISQTPTPSPSPSDETANWQTYTNTKYNFSIKYPLDWLIGYGRLGSSKTDEESEKESSAVGWSKDDSIFAFRVINPCNSALQDCVDNFRNSEYSMRYVQAINKTVKRVTYLGKEAIIEQYTEEGRQFPGDKYKSASKEIKEVFFIHQGQLWQLGRGVTVNPGKEKNKNEIESIFSTFKFQ